MPRQYGTISHKDLGKGLDARSVETQIQDGYWERLENLDTSAQGYVYTRKGTQIYAGSVPIKATGATFRTGAGGAYIDFDIINTGFITSINSIIVVGRTFENSPRDFTSTVSTKYYSTFTIVDTNTIRVLGSTNYTQSLGAIGTLNEFYIYGLILSASDEVPGPIKFLDVYRNTESGRVVCASNAGLFSALANTDAPVNTTVPYVGTYNGDQSFGPGFGSLTAYRKQGVINSSGINLTTGLASVTKVEYVGGISTNITVSLPSWVVNSPSGTKTLTDAFVTSYNMLTLSDMPFSQLNGQFPITGVDGSDPNSVVFSVTIPGAGENLNLATNTSWGSAGIFTCQLDVNSNTLLVGDSINTITGCTVLVNHGAGVFTVSVSVPTFITPTKLNGSNIQLIRRDSTILSVADMTNILVGDVITVVDTNNEMQTRLVVGKSSVLILDIPVVSAHGRAISVPMRWYPIFSPTSPDVTKIAPIIAPISSSNLIKSTTVANNLYMTNGVDPVHKYDGENISRAGIPPWQPGAFVSVNDMGGSITNNYQTTAYAATSLGSFRVTTASERSRFTAGDIVVDSYDGQEYTVEKVWLDDAGTYGYIQVLGGINSGSTTRSGTISRAYKHRYYARFEIVDANDNVTSTAMYQHQDLEVTLSSASDVHFRFFGYPTSFVGVDYSRLKLKLFRTKANTVYPFYLVATKTVTFTSPYLDIIDESDDVALTQEDPIGVLVPNEIGTGWVDPPVSKYISTLNNRLLLAGIKSDPTAVIDIVGQNPSWLYFWDGVHTKVEVNGSLQFVDQLNCNGRTSVDSPRHLTGYNFMYRLVDGKCIVYGFCNESFNNLSGVTCAAWRISGAAYSNFSTTNLIGNYTLTNATTSSVAISAGAGITTFNQPSSPFVAGDIVFFYSGGTATISPPGLGSITPSSGNWSTWYYVVNPIAGSPGTFQIAHTPGGTPISVTITGSGMKYYLQKFEIVTRGEPVPSNSIYMDVSVTADSTTDAIFYSPGFTHPGVFVGGVVRLVSSSGGFAANAGGVSLSNGDILRIRTIPDTNHFTLANNKGVPVDITSNGTVHLQFMCYPGLITLNSGYRWSYITSNFGSSNLLEKPANAQYYRSITDTAQLASCLQDIASLTGSTLSFSWGQDYDTNRIIVKGTANTLLNLYGDSNTYFVNGVEAAHNTPLYPFITKVFPARMLMSYPNYPEIFDSPFVVSDSDSDSVMDINSADGQQITGIIPFFGDSSFGRATKEGMVVVFKESSIYLVDTNGKATGTNYLFKLATNGIGCTAPGSIVQTSKGIIFANESGIYRLNADLNVTFLGKNLMRVFDQDLEDTGGLVQNWAGHNYIFENKYILSNPASGKAYVYDWIRESGGMMVGAPLPTGAWTTYTNFGFLQAANLNQDSFLSTSRGQVLVRRRTGAATDYRDLQSPINVVGRYKTTDLGESGVRKIIRQVYVSLQVQDHDVTPSIGFLADLETHVHSAGIFNCTSSSGHTVRTAGFTPNTRRAQYIQFEITNSNIDQKTVLAGIDFYATGLTEMGRVQKAHLT